MNTLMTPATMYCAPEIQSGTHLIPPVKYLASPINTHTTTDANFATQLVLPAQEVENPSALTARLTLLTIKGL